MAKVGCAAALASEAHIELRQRARAACGRALVNAPDYQDTITFLDELPSART
jgi:hypothetical protein